MMGNFGPEFSSVLGKLMRIYLHTLGLFQVIFFLELNVDKIKLTLILIYFLVLYC